MQLNQISQLLQPKVGQTKSGINNSSDNNAFELMLQEMMQSTGSKDASNTLGLDSNNSMNGTNLINGINGTDLTSSVNAADETGVQNKTVNGLDSLSLNPQKTAQMLAIMQMSANNGAISDVSGDDSSGDDSDSNSDGLDAIGNSNSIGGQDDISQLLQTVLQNQETSSSNTANSNDLNAQTQQFPTNAKL
ncbi:hypothetical protein [Clostridium sp.]|uniref:hypothetical protein n=1 Tax=Clostridium sp. TaxID=1506 RepID=UPI002849CFC1|nr:hypothetical protein [Clostridium sp.]MDR3596208.1 hypothetical protein [Clostridium sp.]